jgi:hypothetical protein
MSVSIHGRAHLMRGLLIAGAMLLATAALKLASPAYVNVDCAQRVLGIMMGALVVMYANSAPKVLAPLTASCSARTEQTLRRFTGWTLVLGGLGYMGAWLFAPMAHAALVALALLGLAFALVVLRYLRVLLPR